MSKIALPDILAVPTLVPRSAPIPLAYASGYGFKISRDSGQHTTHVSSKCHRC